MLLVVTQQGLLPKKHLPSNPSLFPGIIDDALARENEQHFQMSPQGAVCGNDIKGKSKDTKGSSYATGLTPRLDCNLLKKDLAGTVLPAAC